MILSLKPREALLTLVCQSFSVLSFCKILTYNQPHNCRDNSLTSFPQICLSLLFCHFVINEFCLELHGIAVASRIQHLQAEARLSIANILQLVKTMLLIVAFNCVQTHEF